MMKHCTFIKDVLPIRAGELRLLPDDVAAAHVAAGLVAPNPPDYPARAAPAAEVITKPMAPEQKRPTLTLPNKQVYQTKGSR